MIKLFILLISFLKIFSDDFSKSLFYTATLVNDEINLNMMYTLRIEIISATKIYYIKEIKNVSFSNSLFKNGDVAVELDLNNNPCYTSVSSMSTCSSNDIKPSETNFEQKTYLDLINMKDLSIRTVLIDQNAKTIAFEPVKIVPLLFAHRSYLADTAVIAQKLDSSFTLSPNNLPTITSDKIQSIEASKITGSININNLPLNYAKLSEVANQFNSIFEINTVNNSNVPVVKGTSIKDNDVKLSKLSKMQDDSLFDKNKVQLISDNLDNFGTSNCTGNRNELMYKTTDGSFRCIKCHGTQVIVWSEGTNGNETDSSDAHPKCAYPVAYYQ